MASHRSVAVLSTLSASSNGIFRGAHAVRAGLSRRQLAGLHQAGVIERGLPDTYRMTAARSDDQPLRAALLWAGDDAAAGGRSAAKLYGLEGVHAQMPELVVPTSFRGRTRRVVVHRNDDRSALMIRSHRGFQTIGVEPMLVALASMLDGEAFEIACEDARRRKLTSIRALERHLERFPNRRGPVSSASFCASLIGCIHRGRRWR